MDPHIPRPTPTPDGPDDLCISSYTNPFNFLYYIYIFFFLLLYCLVNLLFISVLLLPVLSPGRISPRIPRIASDSREQVICTREIKAPPLSSLLSLVLFYFPSFLKIYLSLELAVENMKRLRSGECWALVDKSSRIRGVKVLEGEREKTALSPSFVLFSHSFLPVPFIPLTSFIIFSYSTYFSSATIFVYNRLRFRALPAASRQCPERSLHLHRSLFYLLFGENYPSREFWGRVFCRALASACTVYNTGGTACLLINTSSTQSRAHLLS